MPHKRSNKKILERHFRRTLHSAPPSFETWHALLTHNPGLVAGPVPLNRIFGYAGTRYLVALRAAYNILVLEPWNELARQFAQVRYLRESNRHFHELQVRKAKQREFYRKFLTGLPRLKYIYFGKRKEIRVKTRKTHFVQMPPKKGRARKTGSGKSEENTSGLRGVRAGDLMLVPNNPTLVPKRVPRAFARQVVWDTFKSDFTLSTSSGGVTETNFQFLQTDSPQSSQFLALYSQFTIVQCAVSFSSTEAPGATSTLPVLHTAVDFNTTASLGTVAALSVYESHVVDTLSPGKIVTRMCHPCCLSLLQVSSGTPTGAVRSWVSSNAPSTPFYGIRSIMESTSAVLTVHGTKTYWIAYRSGI